MGRVSDDRSAPRPLLAAEAISVRRDGRTLVDRASLTLVAGGGIVIDGPSGSGKSTLLRALATLVPIDEGILRFEGRDVRELSPSTFRRRAAYVPQLPRMFPGTVADNLRVGPGYRGETLTDDEVRRLLAAVGLDVDIASRSADALSGGERQRVAIARALAKEPRVLLLDEPTSALDPSAAEGVIALVRSLRARGIASIVVTHVEDHAIRLEAERLTMREGALSVR